MVGHIHCILRKVTHPTIGVTARLVVGIPTYRRPEKIASALPFVLAQVRAMNRDDSAGVVARIVVVDNDPRASAESAVAALAAPELRYVVEAAPGISAARNRILDEAADADLLVFLDDDERPRPGWLDSLVATWRTTGAAGVMGRVVTQLDDDVLDPWIAAGGFFHRSRLPTGTRIDVAASGNLLLDLNQVRAMSLRFDPRFGLSGGEDNLFSRQLTGRGGRLVFCDESVADDDVSAERLTRRWVLTRAWRQGNTFSAVELALAGGAVSGLNTRLQLIVQSLLRIAGGIIRWLVGSAVRSKRRQSKALGTMVRGGGMLAGALGHVYQEYARTEDS